MACWLRVLTATALLALARGASETQDANQRANEASSISSEVKHNLVDRADAKATSADKKAHLRGSEIEKALSAEEDTHHDQLDLAGSTFLAALRAGLSADELVDHAHQLWFKALELAAPAEAASDKKDLASHVEGLRRSREAEDAEDVLSRLSAELQAKHAAGFPPEVLVSQALVHASELAHHAVGRHVAFGSGGCDPATAAPTPTGDQCESDTNTKISTGDAKLVSGEIQGCSKNAGLNDAGFSAIMGNIEADMRGPGPVGFPMLISFSALWDYQYFEPNGYLCAPVISKCSKLLEVQENTDGCYTAMVDENGIVGDPDFSSIGELQIDSMVTVTLPQGSGTTYSGFVTGGSSCEAPKNKQATALTVEADIDGLGHLSVHTYLQKFQPQYISVDLVDLR